MEVNIDEWSRVSQSRIPTRPCPAVFLGGVVTANDDNDNNSDSDTNDNDNRDDNDGDKQQQRPPRSHCRRGQPRSRRRHSAPQWPAPVRHPTPAAATHGLGGSGGARPPRHAARPGTPASLPAAAPRPAAPAAPGVAKGVNFHKRVDFSDFNENS